MIRAMWRCGGRLHSELKPDVVLGLLDHRADAVDEG